MKRIAVILFNLGGPDSPAAVRPFLFNLFNDSAIIPLPGPLRWLLARFISGRRAPIAREIYAQIGGSSPLLANSEAAARSLESALADLGTVRCFPSMRYWHPRANEVVADVKAFGPDEIVFLPQYPQFSTTTTASSMREWSEAARNGGLTAPSRGICCYPREPGFIAAMAEKIKLALRQCPSNGQTRVLFSAHGLPKRTVERGDPYQWQIERTADALAVAVGDADLDWRLCYQSRVGRLEWIGPSTDLEIENAGADGSALIVVPIGFVSEHSETLVELDIEYRELAEKAGVPTYLRVDTVGISEAFIGGLAQMVRDSLGSDRPRICAQEGGRICPKSWTGCAQAVDSPVSG